MPKLATIQAAHRLRYDRERLQAEDQEFQSRPKQKCGKRKRDGTPCEQPAPCYIHTLAPGKKWCSSTLDSDPHERCGLQCDIGELYCDKHRQFPDLGRKVAALYSRIMIGGPLSVDFYRAHHFREWAYPGSKDDLQVHDFAKYAKAMHAKMTSE